MKFPEAPPAADYQVRLDIFEGPLDLLLYLVRKEEVELYEVSLESLIQQYLDYLGAAVQPDLDRAGDFIAMAAHLIYLKSRRLLPPEQRPVGTDDSAEEDDPHWDLIRQLIEYKKFKDVASHLQTVEINRLDLFARPPTTPPDRTEAEELLAGALALGDVGVFDLLGAFQRMLRRHEQRDRAAKESGTVIFEENHTVADKIERLRAMIAGARGRRLAFTELFTPTASRVELVVTFLALLELVRLQQLRVEQSGMAGEITISAREPVGIPALATIPSDA